MKQVSKIIQEKKTRGAIIDELAVFEVYCQKRKDGRLNSCADVARKMKIDRKIIERIAKKGDWVKSRRLMAENAVLQTQKTLGEQMRDKNIEHMRDFEELANIGKKIIKGEMRRYMSFLDEEGKPVRGKFSAFALSVANSMVIDGIKGQRVTLGLPTDVTKSMALNLNLTEELPREEIEQMQGFLDANFNKRQIGNGATTEGTTGTTD